MRQFKRLLGYFLCINILIIASAYAHQSNSLDSEFLQKLSKKFARFICSHCPQSPSNNQTVDNSVEITDSPVNEIVLAIAKKQQQETETQRLQIEELRNLFALTEQKAEAANTEKQILKKAYEKSRKQAQKAEYAAHTAYEKMQSLEQKTQQTQANLLKTQQRLNKSEQLLAIANEKLALLEHETKQSQDSLLSTEQRLQMTESLLTQDRQLVDGLKQEIEVLQSVVKQLRLFGPHYNY